MPNSAKLASFSNNNIFLQNTFALVLQFPFENPATVENFKQLLAKRSLKLRKMSKSALHRQLTQVNVNFIPTFGANFILVHNDPEQVLPVTQWNELLLLIQQNQARVLFLKNKSLANQKAIWYDNNRLLEHSTLVAQPPFSSSLYHLLKSKTVIPLLTNNVLPLLYLLSHRKEN